MLYSKLTTSEVIKYYYLHYFNNDMIYSNTIIEIPLLVRSNS